MSIFRRPTVRDGRTPEPETPYQKAAQIWDERIGSARVQAKNWRLMAFGSLILSVGLAGGLVWQSTHGTVVPWVVQVDKLGQAQAVAPATADYTPSDPQIAWYLAQFIQDVRAVPADPVVVRQNWLQAYDLHVAGGQRRINTDRYSAMLTATSRFQLPDCGITLVKDAAGDLKEFQTDGRRTSAAVGSLKEAGTKAILYIAQAPAECRLTDA
jgi:type IV secretory pathway TrbF-like protein